MSGITHLLGCGVHTPYHNAHERLFNYLQLLHKCSLVLSSFSCGVHSLSSFVLTGSHYSSHTHNSKTYISGHGVRTCCSVVCSSCGACVHLAEVGKYTLCFSSNKSQRPESLGPESLALLGTSSGTRN